MKTTFDDAYLYLINALLYKTSWISKMLLIISLHTKPHPLFLLNFSHELHISRFPKNIINMLDEQIFSCFYDQLISFKYFLVYIYLHFCFGFAKTNPTKRFVVTLYPGVHLVRNKSPIIGKVLPENVQCHF